MAFVYYFIPLFGALIGGISTVFALLLLVKPRLPIKIGPLTLQGLIPKYARKIAQKLAESLANDFSIESWLQEKPASPDVQLDVKKLLNERLEGLVSSLRQQIPMGEIFLTGALAEKLKKQATEELMKMLPQIPQALAAHLSLKEIVGNMMDRPVDPYRQGQLEQSVKAIVKKDILRLISFTSLLGFILGLIELAVIYAADKLL